MPGKATIQPKGDWTTIHNPFVSFFVHLAPHPLCADGELQYPQVTGQFINTISLVPINEVYEE